MYEHHTKPPLPRWRFVRRLFRHFLLTLGLMAVSLGIGMLGYRYFEDLDWLDAFVNAAMLLGGMGPLHNPTTTGGKLFAGLYALYAGLLFLVVVGIMLAPIVHRVLHRFHWEHEHQHKR